MLRDSGPAKYILQRPQSIVLFILGLSITAYSILVGFPFFLSERSVFVTVFGTGAIYNIVTTSYALAGLYAVWGSISDNIPHGSMVAFLAYISLALLRLLSVGPDPFIWVFNTALGLIAAFVFIYHTLSRRGDGRNGG